MQRESSVVLRILISLFFAVRSFADCDLTTETLQDLRISLLCSCENDVTACTSLVDATQLQSQSDIAASVGMAIGTRINYQTISKNKTNLRTSTAGFNDWTTIAFKECSLIQTNELKEVLMQDIDSQIIALNSNQSLCNKAENLYQSFVEPHFKGKCINSGGIAVSPVSEENSVEHTITRLPSSLGFAQQIRSQGGETAPDTRRPFNMEIKGKTVTLDYILKHLDSNNRVIKPSLKERDNLVLKWSRHKREFIEMANCCNRPPNNGSCKKYQISK